MTRNKLFLHGAAVLLAAGLLSGCVTTPVPLTRDEQLAELRADRVKMFRDQEPITHPLTVYEAMARAIKYNLDNRLKLMEQALSYRQLDLANYDLLPKLTAAAGYDARDPQLASSSQDIATGVQSLAPSTSQDKRRRTAELSLTWNILDFGVSYFEAKQQADRTLVMKERRRKVVQSLMQQVRRAYWLALGAQQLETKIEPLLQQVQQALDNSRRIEQERLRPPVEALNYQRELLDTLRQLEGVRDELAQAKPRLAALMNIEPGHPFTLAVPAERSEPELKANLPAMEEAALLHRPELVEARYDERIGVLETKKAIARLFPGLELNLSRRYDSNSFLVDNRWNEAGARISWNLLNVFSAPTILKTADAQLEVTRTQRLALSMAVLAQVHVAYRDFLGRKRQYQLAQDLDDVDGKLLAQARNAARNDARGRLAEISASLNSLFSQLRLYESYGALQSAYGEMLATLGADPLPREVPGYDIATLTAAVADAARKGWQAVPAPEAPPKPTQ